MVFRKNLRSLERRWEKISKFLGDLHPNRYFTEIFRWVPLKLDKAETCGYVCPFVNCQRLSLVRGRQTISARDDGQRCNHDVGEFESLYVIQGKRPLYSTKGQKNEEYNKNNRFARQWSIVTCPVSSTPRRSQQIPRFSTISQ